MKPDVVQDEQISIEDAELFADIAQTERIGLGDLIIAGILAAATWVLLSVWDLPILHPSLWEDVAVANGIRPAAHLVGGFFVAAASFVFRSFGPHVGEEILGVLGKLCVSGIAIVAYASLREMLAFIMRARPQKSKRRSLVMQIASIVGTVAFVSSEPVWRAGQCLSESTMLIALAMFSLEFFFVFLRKGSLKYAYLCAFFLGLLSAESPYGFVLLGGFIAVNNIVLNVLPVLESPFFKPEVLAVSKWYMTFIFIAATLLGIAVNCVSFAVNDGLVVLGETAGVLPLLYLRGYAEVVMSAASLGGWILWLGVCLAPFIVAIIRFPSAADEETFLSYATGIVFLFCGIVAFSQVAPVPVLWFWTHFPVRSDFMLAMGLLWTATTLAAGVTILGVDALCRNHARLARQMFGQDDDGNAEGSRDAENEMVSPVSTAIRRMVVVAVPAVMIVAMLPDRMDTKTRTMLGIVKDALSECVREAGSAAYLFTDGNLDTGIELESFRSGGHLKCLPLVSRTAGSARDVYLRTRGMQADAEDLFSFKFDVGTGLRSWIRDKPKRLEKSAVMMGFDLWKRDGKSLPPMGGLMSRPTGWPSEAERLASIDSARTLIDRIMGVYGMPGRVTSEPVNDAFLAVQWRLSRMCTYRGEQADLAGDAQAAIAEAESAKRLNDKNETYKQLLAAMSRQNDMIMQRLTPREGLQLALVRADFTMGKLYAETILVADPENADANFAMGMFYVKERQLTRAEEYLKRCLIRRPNEPSVYNNLAMVQLDLGKFDAAELNAKKALAFIPDSVAVQDTIKRIKAAREKRTDDKDSKTAVPAK